MNNIKKLALLLAVLAAGNSAWAQVQVLTVPPGAPYTFSSDTAAVGGGTITYQWFRDGQPIAGATDPDYTLPANLASGKNVVFIRGAMSSSCSGSISYANAFIISFCGLLIDDVCWASANVAQPYTFAAKPDMYTEFYQWNRLTAYSATDPHTPVWNSTADESDTWTINPCPAGWRLPIRAEWQALNNAGSTWVAAYTRGNEVSGRFYGPNHASCTFVAGGNMNNCIFLPAGGNRNASGTLGSHGTDGYYWNNAQYSVPLGFIMYFSSSSSPPTAYTMKSLSLNIRCVR